MSKNFIDDGTTDLGDLPATKVNAERIIDPTTQVTAQDINILVQALKDTRARFAGGIGSDATPLAHGLMSAADKATFDNLLSRVNVLDYGAVPDMRLATATLTTPVASTLVAGKTFSLVIDDVTQAFRFRKAGDGLTDAHADILVVNGESASRTANRIARVIAGDNYSVARCDAYAIGSQVLLESNAIGAAGNKTNSVDSGIGSGFTLTNFTGGVDGTDNRVAILAAVAAAQADTYGPKVVWFPKGAGHYRVAVDLTHTLQIQGTIKLVAEGMGASGLFIGLTGGSPNTQITSIVDSLLFVYDGDYEIKDLRVSGPTGNYTGVVADSTFVVGVQFTGFANARIKATRCRFDHLTDNAFWIDCSEGTCEATLTDLWINGASDGIYVGTPVLAGIKPPTIRIERMHSRVQNSTYSESLHDVKGHGHYFYPFANYHVSDSDFVGGCGTTSFGGQIFGVDHGAARPSEHSFVHCNYSGGSVNFEGGYDGTKSLMTGCTFDGFNSSLNVYVGNKGVDMVDCIFLGSASGVDRVTAAAVENSISADGPVLVRGGAFRGVYQSTCIYQASTQTKRWTIDNPRLECTSDSFFAQGYGNCTTADVVLCDIVFPASGFSNLANAFFVGTFRVSNCVNLGSALLRAVATDPITGDTLVQVIQHGNVGQLFFFQGVVESYGQAGSLVVYGPDCSADSSNKVRGYMTYPSKHGSDKTAAATLELDGDSNHYTVTGNTQIDNIKGTNDSHKAYGGRLSLRFTGTPILSASGNVKALHNRARQAGSLATFDRYLISGTWYWVEVSSSGDIAPPNVSVDFTGVTDGTLPYVGRNTVYFVTSGGTDTLNRASVAGFTKGDTITLYSLAGWTLHHGVAAGGGYGGFLLYTGADIVFAAKGTVTLVYDGTNWVQDGYQITTPA